MPRPGERHRNNCLSIEAEHEDMSTGQSIRAGVKFPRIFPGFFLEYFAAVATIKGGGCEKFAAMALSQLWCLVGWEDGCGLLDDP